MDLIQWSPGELEDLHTAVNSTLPLSSRAITDSDVNAPGTLESAKAELLHDSVLTNAIEEDALTRDEQGRVIEADPSWNPYTYVRQNWDDKKRAEFEPELRRGLFENEKTPEQVEKRALRLSRDKERLRIMSQGPGLGVLLGGLGAGLIDLAAVPGIGGKAEAVLQTPGRIARALKLGASAATFTGASELALHNYQDLRTAQESFVNIGVAGLLGGGLGLFGRAIDKRSPLHPDHPDNPLHPDNLDKQGIVFRTPEGEEEIIGSGSLSAAERVGGPRALPGLTSKVPGLRWIGEKITGVTPAGRALTYTGTKSREFLVKMMDLGGSLTDLNRYGVKTVHSAEDIKKDLLVSHSRLMAVGEGQLRALNRELGQSDVAQSLGVRGQVHEAAFSEIARKKLLNEWEPEDTKELVREFGEEAAPKIEQRAAQWAEKIHETNALFEKELIELGRVQDPALVKKLTTDLSSVRSQIAQLEATDSALKKEEGVGVEGKDDKLKELRAERERLIKDLSSETNKPENLGREYGHAQLWDPHSILADQDGFEDFLREVLVDAPDSVWLASRYGMSTEQFQKLGKEEVPTTVRNKIGIEEPSVITPEEGVKLRQDILREWGGDENLFKITRAELQHDSAEAALKQAELDLTDTLRAQGWVSSEVGRLKLSEARKVRDAFHAELERTRGVREELRLFQRALSDASEASRMITLDRQLELTEDGYASATKALTKAEDDLFITVSDSLKDPASKERLVNSGEYVKAVERVARAQAAVDALDEISRRTPGMTIKRARVETKAQTSARALQRAETKVKEMEKRVERANHALDEVQTRLDQMKDAKDAIGLAVSDAVKARNLASKDLRGAKRELSKLAKGSGLDETVENIRRSLMDRNVMPHSIMDRVIPETGRVKARRIVLNAEQRRRGEERGYLRTDLPTILNAQYEQLSGFIGLHKGMDIGTGRTFGSWDDIMREVEEEYRQLRRLNPKDEVKLVKEEQSVKKDLNGLKDRLLGTENLGVDRDGWAYWLSRKVRAANFVRFGGGFLLSSLTDIAAAHLQHGSIAKLLKESGAETVDILKKMYTEDPSMFTAMLNAAELGAQGNRLARALDAEDAINVHGIGARGSKTHRFTSLADRSVAWLSDKVNVVSGMRAWNGFWKIAGGIQRAYHLRDAVTKFGALSDLEKAKLASLGIDDAAAGRIARQIEKHGVTENGHWDPNLDDWVATREGREAARDFRIAIERDMARTVFTPGIGDTPLLMSKEAGKLWLQFQTYAFTFMNRFMIPASQRIATYKDAQAMVSFAHLAWTGMLVVLGKDLLNGRDPSERFQADKWADTTFNIVDRSGLLSYLSPYVDSVLKSPLQETLFGENFIGPTSRFARNSWTDSLLGAQFGLYRDIRDFGTAATSADGEKVVKKGLLLVPFNTQFRLMHQLLDEE